MERFSEQEARRQLRHFDAVWARVDASRSARDMAQRGGMQLMPRKGCCKRPRPGCGR